MRLGTTKFENELTANEVRKGHIIEMVSAWNFFQGCGRDLTQSAKDNGDIYIVETWEVAAIGRKIMRLVRHNDYGQTFGENVYLQERADGVVCFQDAITWPGNGEALAKEMAAADPFSQETIRVMSRQEAINATIKF